MFRSGLRAPGTCRCWAAKIERGRDHVEPDRAPLGARFPAFGLDVLMASNGKSNGLGRLIVFGLGAAVLAAVAASFLSLIHI